MSYSQYLDFENIWIGHLKHSFFPLYQKKDESDYSGIDYHQSIELLSRFPLVMSDVFTSYFGEKSMTAKAYYLHDNLRFASKAKIGSTLKSMSYEIVIPDIFRTNKSTRRAFDQASDIRIMIDMIDDVVVQKNGTKKVLLASGDSGYGQVIKYLKNKTGVEFFIASFNESLSDELATLITNTYSSDNIIIIDRQDAYKNHASKCFEACNISKFDLYTAIRYSAVFRVDNFLSNKNAKFLGYRMFRDWVEGWIEGWSQDFNIPVNVDGVITHLVKHDMFEITHEDGKKTLKIKSESSLVMEIRKNIADNRDWAVKKYNIGQIRKK